MNRMSARAWLAISCVIFLAFALRLADLTRRPLHYDEGNNVYFGHLSLAGVLRDSIETADTDPPGHRLALGVWMRAAGPSPFAIRLFSVMWGVLTVAAVFRIGRWLDLPFFAALLAATLCAASAYAIDNTQQAKGYALSAGAAALSWLFLIAQSRQPARAAAAGYVFSAGLALTTHFMAAPLFVMHWAWLRQARQTRFSMMGLIAQQALAAAPTAIWAALVFESVVRGTMGLSADSAPRTLPQVLMRIFGEFAIGQFAGASALNIGAALLLTVCGLGGFALWRAGKRAALVFGATLLLPVIGALALSQRVTFFFPRFLLYALPSVCVLCAGVLMLRARRLAAVVGLVTVLGCAAGLGRLWTAPVDLEYEFRPLAAELEKLVKPGDLGLATYIWVQGLMQSYAPEAAAMMTWERDVFGPLIVDTRMPSIAEKYARIWSFNFKRDPRDPASSSAAWLRAHAAEAGRIDAGAMATVLFLNTAPAAADRSVTFANAVTLRFAGGPTRGWRGDTIAIDLRWSTPAAIPDDLSIFAQLLGPDGRPVGQSDGDAVNGFAPAHSWQPGVEVLDRRALLIPPDAAPGEYRVVAGLYRRANGARIMIDGADSVDISRVEVAP